VALALGAVAAILAVAYLRSAEARSRIAEQVVPMRPVVVAKLPIPAGEKITLNMIEVRPIPSNTFAADAYSSVEQVVGLTARYPFSPGEQISAVRLVNATSGAALSFQIPPGMRGFTLPINAGRAPASLIVPGDFVDVLAILQGEDLGLPVSSTTQGVATVLQNVQVLAVATQYVAGGAPYDSSVRGAPAKTNVSSITVAVTPEEAQQLTLLVERSRLFTFSLRPFGEEQTKALQPSVGRIEISPDRPTLPQP
jgi:Flp pilus assembly protein CpaB